MEVKEFQNKLEALQNKLEKEKEEKTRLEWEQDKILKELKEMNFDSIEDSEKEINKINKKIIFMDKKIKKGITEFQEKYGEYFE